MVGAGAKPNNPCRSLDKPSSSVGCPPSSQEWRVEFSARSGIHASFDCYARCLMSDDFVASSKFALISPVPETGSAIGQVPVVFVDRVFEHDGGGRPGTPSGICGSEHPATMSEAMLEAAFRK